MTWILAFLSFYLWVLGGIIMGGFYSQKTKDDSFKNALFILFTWPIAPVYYLLVKR